MTATRLSVIFEKSMKALAMGEAMGAVRSRISTIRMPGMVPQFLQSRQLTLISDVRRRTDPPVPCIQACPQATPQTGATT
jgi:hypothetical protein